MGLKIVWTSILAWQWQHFIPRSFSYSWNADFFLKSSCPWTAFLPLPFCPSDAVWICAGLGKVNFVVIVCSCDILVLGSSTYTRLVCCNKQRRRHLKAKAILKSEQNINNWQNRTGLLCSMRFCSIAIENLAVLFIFGETLLLSIVSIFFAAGLELVLGAHLLARSLVPFLLLHLDSPPTLAPITVSSSVHLLQQAYLLSGLLSFFSTRFYC